MDKNALGLKLKDLREAKKWTQKDLEAKSGVSERTIQEIERGKANPSVSYLFDLGVALGEHLIFFEPPPPPSNRPADRDLKALIEAPDRAAHAVTSAVLQELLAVAPEIRATVLAVLFDDENISRPYLEKHSRRPKAR